MFKCIQECASIFPSTMAAVKESELRLRIMSQSGDQHEDSEKLQVAQLKLFG